MDCSQLIRKDMAAKKQTSSQKLDLVEHTTRKTNKYISQMRCTLLFTETNKKHIQLTV
jgi:RNA-splicing ligase RtcB